MTPISSDFFVWTNNKGVCDVTDLPPGAPWRDGLIQRFNVVSTKTGKVAEFEFLTSLFDDERADLVGWRYSAILDGHRFVIDILND
jgi:hypothetical protein